MKKKTLRLLDRFVPTNYDITLHLDMDAFLFIGEESVELNLKKKEKEIVLHAKDLQVTRAVITDTKTGKEQVAKVSYNTKQDWVILRFANAVPGRVVLRLDFRGVISESMHGLYRSSFEHKGQKKHLATTQFEATDARRCFPCVDEPAAKAVFHISISAPREHTVISNTLPVSKSELENDRQLVKFAPSPKMSTYLVAIVSGEMECLERLETKKKRKTLVRVFTVPGKKKQAAFALDTTVKVLEFFEQYFDIDYPLDTLDLVAVPDFEAGAMENWGAITFRESSILIDEKNSSADNMQWVAGVIAHELAHQWFGNLVTMEWWTHLWLNEGFASYIGTLAVSKVFPEWKTWEGFMNMDFVRGLNKDAGESSHPIEIEVHHPSEIDQIFDDVSYHKGASIIRMLASFLGEEVFRQGLSHYLKKHSFRNAVTEDLWRAFEYISKKPVGKIMSTWTSQKGFPLLTVHESANGISITQEKFSFKKNNSKTLWQIPLVVLLKKGKKQVSESMLLTRAKQNFSLDDFAKVNSDSSAFLRVNYSPERWEKLKEDVVNGKLNILDRFGLLSDVFTLCRAGKLRLDFALDFLEGYSRETELDIILEIIAWIWAVARLTRGSEMEQDFRKRAVSLLATMLEHFGYKPRKNDSIEDAQSRGFLLQSLVQLKDSKTIEWAGQMFKQKSIERISPDLRYAVFTGIVAMESRTKQDELFALYEKLQMSEEKERLGQALCLCEDGKLLERSLDFLLSSKVRDQEATYLLKFAAKSTKRPEVLWEFLKSNWSALEKRFGVTSYVLSKVIEMMGSGCDITVARDMKKFFKGARQEMVSMGLSAAIESITINAAWKNREIRK